MPEFNAAELGWIAWVLTVISWIITIKLSHISARRAEFTKLTDQLIKHTHEVEDLALKFWIKPENDVYLYELSILLKRISDGAMQLRRRRKQWIYPAAQVKNLRQAITLDAEDKENRSVSEFSERARHIMAASQDFQHMLWTQI